jgi:hypothetical protein
MPHIDHGRGKGENKRVWLRRVELKGVALGVAKQRTTGDCQNVKRNALRARDETCLARTPLLSGAASKRSLE